MSKYGAQDIQILKGLEHVRRRPSMYIGDVGLKGYHHLLREVVDNAVDEFLDGHVTKVWVKLCTKTQQAEIRDDGRGIPVSIHPKAGISTLTAVFTKLHAGGKFGKGAYTAAVAGLHGIGVKAVNALSTSLTVWTKRKKKVWVQEFVRGEAVADVAPSDRKLAQGTVVQFTPDAKIFGDARWKPAQIAAWLRDTSYLCPGLKIRLTVDGKHQDYHAAGGLAELLKKTVQDRELLADPIILSTDEFDLAFCWTDLEGEHWRSFVNVIHTPSHGTHVQGAKRAISDALNDLGDRYRGEDLRDGLMGVVHARVIEPQFKGQTKVKLENAEVETTIYEAVYRHLQRHLAENSTVAKKLRDRAQRLQKARDKFRAEQKAIKGTRVKKGARGLLPGKLVEAPDCTPAERELFIVEGLSAEGTVTAARVQMKKQKQVIHYQEVYPLRGKLANAARAADLATIAKNQVIKDLFTAIGTGVGDAFDLRKSRCAVIYLLMDADPDGKHILALLLSLFVRYMPDLIKADMLRVVQNPLFMGVTAKQRVYGNTVAEVKQQFSGKDKPIIRRFKGLGESNPTELQEYALDPKTRSVLRVVWDDENEDQLVLKYMGADSTARKELLGIE